MTQEAIDITSFDTVTACEKGHPFELKGADGVTGTGITLIVLGSHADIVNKWINKVTNQAIKEQHMASRKGRPVEPKSLDEIREQNIEGACVRVTGWAGVKQDFSAELLKSALKRNPHWIDQIVEESNDLQNFTQAQ